MRQKSITLNAILNMIKVSLVIVFQLITYPYVLRVLSVENLGNIDYAHSITSYFGLFAQLGAVQYAVREGSKLRNNQEKVNEFISEIFSLNLVASIIAYVVLAICTCFIDKFAGIQLLLFINGMNFIFTTMGIEWMNTIYEDFLYITIRSIVIYIISLICIFVLVRTPDDYIIYVILTVLPNFFVCLSNLIYCRRYARYRVILKKKTFRHLKPLTVFFINSLAISIYINADATMIGWIIGPYYNGLYGLAVRIYTTVKTVLGAIYAVTIPRLSKAIDKGEWDTYKTLLTDLCSVLSLLILPASTGLIVLGKEVVCIVGGAKYLEGTLSLQILAVALIFAVFAGLLVTCVNTPSGKEMVSLKATIVSALANLILNLFFIPWFKHNGAALTTVFSEFLVCAISIAAIKDIRKYIDLRKFFVNITQAIIGCIWIIAVGVTVKLFNLPMVMNLILIMFISIIGYLVILIIAKNSYALHYLREFKLIR